MARVVELNGEWTLAGYNPGAYDAGAAPCVAAMPARVPGFVQGDLIRAHVLPDPRIAYQSRAMEWTAMREWVYETRFDIPEEPQEGRSERFYIELGGVAGACDVFVNGVCAGSCEDVWERPAFDVTGVIKRDERNALSLRFRARPPIYGRYARLDHLTEVTPRFSAGWQGCPPMPVTGVTERVALRCVSFLRIEHMALRAQPYGENGGRINVILKLDAFAAGRYNFKYRVLLGDELVANEDIPEQVVAARTTVSHRITAPKISRWEPGAGGCLYTFMLTITRGGVRCDMAEDTVGFRTVELGDALTVNGKPVFVSGARLWPPYPFFDDAHGVCVKMLAALKAAGFNLVRLYGGALPPADAFLSACDALGMLVWCDCPLTSGEGELSAHPSYIEQLTRASEALALRVGNHPCCALLGGGGINDRDGCKLDARHPTLAALARLMERPDIALPFMPDDGPFEYIAAQGVATHRNAEMQSAGSAVWPPDALSQLLAHQDTALPPYMRSIGNVQPGRLPAIYELGRALQAARLRRALLQARKWDGAGFIVDGVNEPFPAIASGALIEHDGALRPAFWAVAGILGDAALCVECPESARPGDAAPIKALFLSRHTDGRPLNARVRVLAVTGETLVNHVVSTPVETGVTALYDGMVELPRVACLLIVRVEGEYGGAPLTPATEFLCVSAEETALEPFMHLPPVRLHWSSEGAAWRLTNTSLYTAAHVVIHPSGDGAQPLPGVLTLPPHESAAIAGVKQPRMHAVTVINEQVTVTAG